MKTCLRFFTLAVLSLFLALPNSGEAEEASGTNGCVRRIDGYRGIWFDLGQRSEFGSKYSGGFATYPQQHHPLAVYAPAVQKTFFVYGGTTEKDKRYLLAMVSYYDHQTKTVPKPVVVHDKQGVDDPHENPCIQIDETGHLWVFVSGRANKRPGHIYRSRKPYDIESFEYLSERQFAYPQPWWIEKRGFLFLFIKYTGVRELYWSASDASGKDWSKDRKLAGMGGHYQVSNERNGKVITAFNMHPGGDCDKRTNLYFLQTTDCGKTWQTASGETVKTPLIKPDCSALVHDYRSEKRLVYMKDIGFDAEGNPVILYLTSSSCQPGPAGAPRTWTLAHWTQGKWVIRTVTTSTHNYDMGSLYIEPDGTWRIIAPTEKGPQEQGTGGEIAVWCSRDQGATWEKTKTLTANSTFNHGFVRRPRNAHDDFYGFWADGNTDKISESRLYFTNKAGDQIRCLPYTMTEAIAYPALTVRDQ
jgi:hypothetical protein